MGSFSFISLVLLSLMNGVLTTTSPIQRQQTISRPLQQDWQKYIRSPSSKLVRPVKVFSEYSTGNVTNPDGHLTGRGATILARRSQDLTPSIVVDFGMNVVGLVSIDFGGSYNITPGLPGIRLAFSETLQYLSNYSDFTRSWNGAVSHQDITPGTDQVAVRPESYTWTGVYGCAFEDTKVCSDGLHGFRYMKISLDAHSPDAPYTTSFGEVSINSVSLNISGYLGTPDSFIGWFESSDEVLTQWWYDGVYTVDIGTDVFRANDTDPRNSASSTLINKTVLYDGAKRDRDPYVGDLAVASLTSYLSHNVPEASRNVLADLADHQRVDGWIPPASIFDYTLHLFDYPLYWVTCSYDYVVYMGDTDYIKQYYPHMVKVLDTFYPSVTSNTTNLITKGLGVSEGYGDYGFIPRTGAVTYYNALYILALRNAASLATSLGKQQDAARWTVRAELVSTALNTYNFDESVGAFFDGECGPAFCQTHAQDGNSFAIVAGAVNSSRQLSALEYLSKAHSRPYGNSFYDNDLLSAGYSQRVYAFISYFELRARFMSGLTDSGLEELRRLYGWMSTHDPGVTMWEGIGANGEPYEGGFTSMAHGWSTGVVPLATNFILGIIPTGPGFTTYNVKPMPGDIKWARGVVPTPNGPVTVSWTNDAVLGVFHLSASGPVGARGTISVPVAYREIPVYVDGKLIADGVGVDGFKVGDGHVSMEFTDGETHYISVGGNHQSEL